MRKTILVLALMAVIAAVALIAVPTLTRGGVDYDVSEVLRKIGRAYHPGTTSGPGSGLKLIGEGKIEGLECEATAIWDGEGRLLFETRGQFRMAVGYDLETSWEQDDTGAVRRLDGIHSAMRLVPYQLVIGSWTRPSPGVEVVVDRKKSSKRLAVLDVLLDGQLYVTVYVDTATWLPEKAVMLAMGRELAFMIEGYLEYDGRALPERMSLTDDGKTMSRVRFTEVQEVESFPSGYFGIRENASRAVFDNDAPTELEVRRGRWGHLFVRPQVNGQEIGWFAFDTGATRTKIDSGVAKKAGLPHKGHLRITGIGGHVDEEWLELASFRVGPMTVDSLTGITGRIGDLGLAEQPVGLLGMDVLSSSIIVYDQKQSAISLCDPESYELPRGEWSPMVAAPSNQPTIRMTFEGHEGFFVIDTGNPGAVIVSPYTTARYELLQDRTTSRKQLGGTGGSIAARRGQFKWVNWGGRRFSDVPADFVTEDRGAAASKFQDGIIGTDLLSRYVVVFDMTHNRIAYLPTP